MKLLRHLITCILTIALIWGAMPGALAQNIQNVQEWPYGQVFLTSGDTITGYVTYYRHEEIIKVENLKGVYSVSPVNVNGFVVKEYNALTYREFRTLLWNRQNNPHGFKSPAFFEYIQDGKYSLLKRQIIVELERQAAFANPAQLPLHYIPGKDYQVQELYYLLTPDNRILRLRKLERDLNYFFGSKANQVKAFVKENKLSYRNEQDLAVMVRFYNSLL